MKDVTKLTPAEKAVIGMNTVKPHPDGKAWGKCCGSKSGVSCLCLTRKPFFGQSRLDSIFGGEEIFRRQFNMSADDRFMCVHRTTEDGFHRECAGWAAKRKAKQVREKA